MNDNPEMIYAPAPRPEEIIAILWQLEKLIEAVEKAEIAELERLYTLE